jgi:hypothetical protein
MARKKETFRTLYLDPGEDFGWCIARDTKLLAAGTSKMWEFTDELWLALEAPDDPEASYLNNDDYVREGCEGLNVGPIGRIVCEDFRLYPHVIYKNGRATHALDWDEMRTPRVIGAVTFMCRYYDIPLVFQAAKIKESAVAAGAEELYYTPLRENRHQNDAIQHYTFFIQTELIGRPLKLENVQHD